MPRVLQNASIIQNAQGLSKCEHSSNSSIQQKYTQGCQQLHFLKVKMPNSILPKGHHCSLVADQLSQRVIPKLEKTRRLIVEVHLRLHNLKLVPEDWVNCELYA